MRFVEDGTLYDTDEMEEVIRVCTEPAPFGWRRRVLAAGDADRLGPSRVDTLLLDHAHGRAVLTRVELMDGRAGGGPLSSGSAYLDMHRRLGEPGLPARTVGRAEAEACLAGLWDDPGVVGAYERLFGKLG